MTSIKIEGIRQILNSPETIFMRQGRNGKAVHISDGSCRSNNLYCGITYTRNGRSQSYLYALDLPEIDTNLMCKNCLSNLHSAIQPLERIGA